MNIPEIEKRILEFWQKNKIFKKSLKKKSPKGDFIFYDGLLIGHFPVILSF